MRAVIMGGTSGIGLAAAEQLTEAGMEVTVTGREAAKLDAVRGRVAAAEQLDSTVEGDVAAFFDRIGPFDHLVLAFSPGSVGMGPVRETSLADVRAAFDGKLFAYLSAIQHAQVAGSITMISASSARAAMPTTVALAAVNGAIERIVSPLAAELAPVRVNAVSPGLVDTPWWSFVPDAERAGLQASYTADLPVSRVGQADEVAAAVVYLVSAGYVTGSILPVDGGLTVA